MSSPTSSWGGRSWSATGSGGTSAGSTGARCGSAPAQELAKLHTRIPNIDARCKDLSGGQRQALAIARASAWCERVLLLDEPTSALGVEQQREVLDLIRRVRDLGTAVILVSHQMPDVLAVCDRITVLRLGSVVAAVPRKDVSVDDLIAYITGAKARPAETGGE